MQELHVDLHPRVDAGGRGVVEVGRVTVAVDGFGTGVAWKQDFFRQFGKRVREIVQRCRFLQKYGVARS